MDYPGSVPCRFPPARRKTPPTRDTILAFDVGPGHMPAGKISPLHVHGQGGADGGRFFP